MCGVAALMHHPDHPHGIAQNTYLTMYFLHNRGQDSAGMLISREDGTLKRHKGLGTLDRVFYKTREDMKQPEWQGVVSIDHIRYSTSGVNFSDTRAVEQAKSAIQPMEGNFRGKPFAVSYNGNLVDSCITTLYEKLYGRMYDKSSQRSVWVDTELIIQSIEQSEKQTFEEALLDDAVHLWKGAFSIIFLHNNTIWAIRDHSGFRPLHFGTFEHGYIVASEDNIFDKAKFPNAEYVQAIEPGYYLKLAYQPSGIALKYASYTPLSENRNFHKHCAFEDVYFSMPTSRTPEQYRIALFRRNLGRILAREKPPPPNADFVVGVPDSGIHAAHGYAEESHLPYLQEALMRQHGATRSFIEPVSDLRQEGIELKLDVIPEYIEGKVVVVIDDSIVRGNVTPRVVHLLKMRGAREVHMRISSPPVIGPCYYGIDTARIQNELIALGRAPVEKIRQKINERILQRYHSEYTLDSLAYLSMQGLTSIYSNPSRMCYACWDGNYPVL
jgi:amidophosphoribosyltransferase